MQKDNQKESKGGKRTRNKVRKLSRLELEELEKSMLDSEGEYYLGDGVSVSAETARSMGLL